LGRLGVDTVEVRTADELEGISALVLPGGESTTIGRLARRYGLIRPMRDRIEAGMPTLGTCAGLIFLAVGLTTGSQELLEVLDVTVERNAYGRQNESFEADLDVAGLGEPFRAVFIRAPRIDKVGSGVEVVASLGETPVMVRQDKILASSFHPELTDDARIHEMLLEAI
jgi:5'-phosphate synthase pdxT subunit